MAVSGLLAVLDDVATMAKIAAKKTAGIAGDDLAVNSQVVAGLDPKRELPIIWDIAKGSLKNKFLYLIPSALALSMAAPWVITPLMMVGGAYLSYEGIEKILHRNKHDDHDKDKKSPSDPKEVEKKKIGEAIKTDFILSAEIIVVALGAVAAAPFLSQLAVLSIVGIGMTAGIYGIVGGLVKMDDVGLHLAEKKGTGFFAKAQRKIGRGIVKTVPHIMKGISFLGTAAMFAVGGGILLHGLPAAAHAVEALAHLAPHAAVPFIEAAAGVATGLITGLLAVPTVKVMKKPVKGFSNFAQKVKNKIFQRKIRPAAETTTVSSTVTTTANRNEPAADALGALPDLKAAHDAAAKKQPATPQTYEKPEIAFVTTVDKKRGNALQ